MTDKLFQDFLLSPRKIDTSYNLKALKLLQEALIRDEMQDIKFEPEAILNKLNKRIHTLTLYYAKATEKQPYKRFIISYNKEELQTLETDLALLQEYKQDKTLKIKDLIKIKSLAKETLNQDELKTREEHDNKQKQTQDLLKQAITEINRIGNNINQVARDINNRKKLTDKLFNHNLTKEERERMLEATQELENLVLQIAGSVK